jgi:hypothetical protein
MDLDDPEISEFFPPNAATMYQGRLTSVEPNRLHVPIASNQIAVDSVFHGELENVEGSAPLHLPIHRGEQS